MRAGEGGGGELMQLSPFRYSKIETENVINQILTQIIYSVLISKQS
jgi:hypothetical protein